MRCHVAEFAGGRGIFSMVRQPAGLPGGNARRPVAREVCTLCAAALRPPAALVRPMNTRPHRPPRQHCRRYGEGKRNEEREGLGCHRVPEV